MNAITKRMQFENDPGTLLDRPAEKLVITGFRCWMAGYELGDIECWEIAWTEYAKILGPQNARSALSELQYWVRTLRQVTTREITCFPYCCKNICKDECMALSLISAHQRQDRSAARAAAHYISGLNDCASLQELVDAGSSFAAALANAGQILVPVSLDLVERIAHHESRSSAGTQTRH